MKALTWFLAVLGAVLFVTPVAALVPLTTPVQGVLRDGAGVPVADAHFGMTFTLYTGADEAADAVWSEAWPPDGGDCLAETEGCVHVVGGRFRVRLGTHNPLSPEIFGVGPLWLGVQVEAEPELPRRPLGSSPYAHRAAVAGGVDCTGCLDVGALSDGARQALVDEALTAVAAGGYATTQDLEALDLTITEDDLPSTGLDEISNGTLTNAFTHVAASPEPVPILDVNPGGVGSHVVTPDLGIIQAARVRAHVTNSDLSTLRFTLFTLDQETGSVVLYNKGLEGTELETTWPTEMAPVEGTLDTLVGKPTDGVWVFHVIDDGSPVGEGPSPKDGAIVSWALELDVLGGDQVIVQGQVVVNGDLRVAGDTTMEGSAVVAGDLEVGGVLSGPGGIVVGTGQPVCDAEHAGAMHYDTQLQRLVFCDGQKLLQLRACEAICPGPETVACTTPVVDGCGAPCGDVGTGLSSSQCAANAPLISCGEPVADDCDNDCGTQGLALAPALCPDVAIVTCGNAIADPCGNVCGGVGTFCAPGFDCSNQACQPTATSADAALASCQAILDAGVSTGDGVYWLDPDGQGPLEPFEAWCDMELNGGWMLSYIMCQDGGGDARAGGLNHQTPIKPESGTPVSSLGYDLVSATNPDYVRLTSTHTGGMGYLFPWASLVGSANWNPARTLLDGTMSATGTTECADLGPSVAGSTGAQCGNFLIEHNNSGGETHDIPTLGCVCHVWQASDGMLWGQIDGLQSFHGVSHREATIGFSDSPASSDGCILLYVK